MLIENQTLTNRSRCNTPQPPLTPPLAPHMPLQHKLTIPSYLRVSEDPRVWGTMYQPPCLKGGEPKLSPLIVPTTPLNSMLQTTYIFLILLYFYSIFYVLCQSCDV